MQVVLQGIDNAEKAKGDGAVKEEAHRLAEARQIGSASRRLSQK